MPQLNGKEQGKWLAHLEKEHDNFRAALSWSLQRGDDGIVSALRLCAALQPFWRMRGHITEGRQWCESVLALAGSVNPTAEFGDVLNGTGVLARMQGDYATARSYHEQSLTIRRQLGNKTSIAASLNGLGNVASDVGDYTAARDYYAQSLKIKQELGSKIGIAGTLNNLGLVAYREGDYPSARRYYEESLAIRNELGNTNATDIAALLEGLAEISVAEGIWERGAVLWASAEMLREQVGSRLPADELERHDQGVAKIRHALGEEAFASLWAKGRAMTIDQVIAYFKILHCLEASSHINVDENNGRVIVNEPHSG